MAKQAYSRIVDAGIAPDTLVAKALQYAEAKADVDAKWLKMPANWLKEECWREDPQPPRPRREPESARSANALVQRHKPARAKPKQQEPFVNSATSMEKSNRGGRLAFTPARAKTALKREPRKRVGSIPEFIRPGATVFHADRNKRARVLGYGTMWSVRIEWELDGVRERVHYRALLPAPTTPPIAESSKARTKAGAGHLATCAGPARYRHGRSRRLR